MLFFMSNNKTSELATTLPYDLKAGLVTFLVALPLCLGIALASGAPLFSGIIAGVVGGIVVGSLSGSNVSVSGPAAGLTVIVLTAIERLGQFEIFLLAIVVAGILQIGLGYARAGTISHFFPSAVIKGMLASIGLTLILKQIPHAFGYDVDAEGEFEFFQSDGENTLSEILQAAQHLEITAIVIALLSIGMLLLWEKPFFKSNVLLKSIPSALLVVLAGIAVNELVKVLFPAYALSGNHLVVLPILNSFSDINTLFKFPDFSQLTNTQVYLSGATIAIVASLETLLNVEATDKLDPYKRTTPVNQELKAQGVGNIVSGLIGGIPVTSVIVRSSVNINAGARTKMSAIIHAVLLGLCVLLIPRVLNLIPLAALAGILLVTGYKLAKISLFTDMFKQGFSQFFPFVVTIIAVLFTDLLIGIGIGLAVGIFFILRENYKTSYIFRKESKKGGEKIYINLSEHVSFLNKASIIDILENIPENTVVEIDGTKSAFIDHDVVEVIEEFKQSALNRNIRLTFLRKEEEVPQTEVENFKETEKTDFDSYYQLFDNNKLWVAEKTKQDPNYFKNLALGQSPKFLWIGCSDSRVPATEITGTSPGDMFVHRNVANLVVSTDLNLLSVLQYAVEVLKVEHIIVCGHYGCGGVKSAMGNKNLGLINKWLRNIKDVMRLNRNELNAIENEDEKFKRLVELNVIEQVYNLHKTSIIQEAWAKDAEVHVHGWVYDLQEGLIKDLEVDIKKMFEDYGEIYRYKLEPGIDISKTGKAKTDGKVQPSPIQYELSNKKIE
jgi:carbonic anhydrase